MENANTTHLHPYRKSGYVPPDDPLVRARLDQWQDLKFGFMMHWGLYSIEGIVESWALCSEDQDFQDRGGVPYEEYKKWYFDQIKRFNPEQFDPKPWADAAKKAGMKYLVFTTKHHDGFCMFDSRYTGFRVTGPECPFRNHSRANITKEVFDAFREKDFLIGSYFSKPDWHHPDFWSPLWATPSRNVNYDTAKYPEKWRRFRDFTYNQIEELMTGYGPVDILWLDGGWVRPQETINDEVRSWGFDIAKCDQDIDMPRIARMARSHQPGLLIVDRTVHGPYEDYRTPEQTIPGEVLPFPWESCMTLTQSWGFNRDPEYKSSAQIIKNLVDIVSKGGCYLLNAGPTPQGTLEKEIYERLDDIGRWMAVNGEGIYATRPLAQDAAHPGLWFTRSRIEDYTYAFFSDWPAASVFLPAVTLKPRSEVKLLGNNEKLDWRQREQGVEILLKPHMRKTGNAICSVVRCLRFETAG